MGAPPASVKQRIDRRTAVKRAGHIDTRRRCYSAVVACCDIGSFG